MRLIREIYHNRGNDQYYITIPKKHKKEYKPGEYVELIKIENRENDEEKNKY